MKYYLVVTPGCIFYSDRKLDAAYKHVEFRRGTAKYQEVRNDDFKDSDKRLVDLRRGPLLEV